MLLLPAPVDPHRVRDALLAALAVFIAVGLCLHDFVLALHAAVAVCAFGAGAFATARLMPREASVVLCPARVTLGLLGTAFVQLAFWIVWLAVGGEPGSTLMVVLLAISALAMGIQTATAVALGVHAVFTTAATATWTVLAGDAAHRSGTRIERCRLALVLSGTLIGASAGTLLLAHARLWMPLLPALLMAGVAVIAQYRVERCKDATRTTVSSAPRPSTRAFGRTADKAEALSRGR